MLVVSSQSILIYFSLKLYKIKVEALTDPKQLVIN
jgi:hypothetical protein